MSRFNPFKNKYAAWALWACWCLIILKFSSDVGPNSGAKSGRILAVIMSILSSMHIEVDNPDFVHHLIRKGAHMFNFMGLGLVAYNAQRFNSKRTLNQAVIYAFFMAVGFACIDETFQTFVPGRSGQIKDVFIDGFGTTIGLAGLWCGSKFIKYRH